MNYLLDLYTENPELTILLIIFSFIGLILFFALIVFIIVDFKYDVLIPLEMKINKAKKIMKKIVP